MGTMEGLTAMILVGVFPERQRGLALGLRAIGWSAGEAIFYVFGGYLVEVVSWRHDFFNRRCPRPLSPPSSACWCCRSGRESVGRPVDYPGLLALAGFLIPVAPGHQLDPRHPDRNHDLVMAGPGRPGLRSASLRCANC